MYYTVCIWGYSRNMLVKGHSLPPYFFYILLYLQAQSYKAGALTECYTKKQKQFLTCKIGGFSILFFVAIAGSYTSCITTFFLELPFCETNLFLMRQQNIEYDLAVRFCVSDKILYRDWHANLTHPISMAFRNNNFKSVILILFGSGVSAGRVCY